ncbi:MAG: hypothetical protein U9Q83_05415, partial [Bacteroidota bacterium]|nr:hypothetical protein [Bacteroidota bacterium]
KTIKFKSVILLSYIIFSILATLVILFSALDSYKTNRLYYTKADFMKLSLNYVYIDKYQDFLLIEDNNVFWGSQLNYNALNDKINSSIVFIDSIINNDKLTKGDLFTHFSKLKNSIIAYESIIEKVNEINKELYDPTMGIKEKNSFLQKTIYNEKYFEELGLISYFSQLVELSIKLNQNEISKKEYQKNTIFYSKRFI